MQKGWKSSALITTLADLFAGMSELQGPSVRNSHSVKDTRLRKDWFKGLIGGLGVVGRKTDWSKSPCEAVREERSLCWRKAWEGLPDQEWRTHSHFHACSVFVSSSVPLFIIS